MHIFVQGVAFPVYGLWSLIQTESVGILREQGAYVLPEVLRYLPRYIFPPLYSLV